MTARRPRPLFAILLGVILAAAPARAQRDSDALAPDATDATDVGARLLEASLRTNTEARALRMTLPAPRGLITDRNGRIMAQNRVVQQAAINFPFMRNASDDEILAYARRRFTLVNTRLGTDHDLPDETILRHYEHRRWLPLVFTPILTNEQLTALEPFASMLSQQKIFLFASYQRFYPMGSTAAHIVGNIGRIGWVPTGPIEIGDPLWENIEGRSGIELSYEADLRGTDGWLSQLFSADGEKIAEQIEKPAVAGHSVVLTIDATMQERAEGILSRKSKRGAFVVIDIESGDLLVLASWPTYDPNIWIPSISREDFQKLREDPAKPLLARAYQGTYPPASVFKVPVALAALESGTVNRHSLISGPPSFAVGNRVFNNWNKNHEGNINVIQAMARSTNTWFYQAALRMGADPILDVSHKLGFGQRTGIPLQGENPGFVPDHEWAKRYMGRDRLVGGAVANMAIGQGALSVTPLQQARAMAAIGRGTELPVVNLVRQVQDHKLDVVRRENNKPGIPTGFSLANVDTILESLEAVTVSGTARSAAVRGHRLGGKTGTGQWIIARRQNVAWFCGIVPIDKPRYAFAILYEGAPGEKVGGGSSAAPLAPEFFKPLLDAEKDAESALLADARNQAIEEAMRQAETDARSRAALETAAGAHANPDTLHQVDDVVRNLDIPVRQARPVAPPPEPEPERRGFFQRLFGRGNR